MKPLTEIKNNDENTHRLNMLHASDLSLPGSILLKFPNFQFSFVLSLDHSVYFHGNHIDFNNWHFFNIECVFSGKNGVSLNRSK